MDLVMDMKKFYELNACRRHAGSQLEEPHKICLSMLNINFKDVVLDIGCGGGGLLSEITKKATAVGLDTSKIQIKYAKTHLRDASLLVGDAERLPFKNYSFTKCFAVAILEHVPNPKQMMNEVRSVLKYRGQLIIVVPNDRNWFVYRFLEGYFHDAFYNYGHRHDFSSLEKLKPLLKGFKILAVEEHKRPTIFMKRFISQLFQSLNRLLKKLKYKGVSSEKERESTYSNLKPFLSIAPRLTLNLIIKLEVLSF